MRWSYFAAVRLIDLAGFRRLAAFRRNEVLLALAAPGGALVFDIRYGVLLAVGLSVAAIADQPDPVAWFVLNVEAIVEVDSTGLAAMDALRADLTGRDVVFALARVKQDLRVALDTYGLTAAVGPDRIFPTLPTAVAAYEAWRTGSR